MTPSGLIVISPPSAVRPCRTRNAWPSAKGSGPSTSELCTASLNIPSSAIALARHQADEVEHRVVHVALEDVAGLVLRGRHPLDRMPVEDPDE